jgi:hypothetical protein
VNIDSFTLLLKAFVEQKRYSVFLSSARSVVMTANEFYDVITGMLHREPFRAFVVELQDGSRVEFDRPRSLAIRGGAAGGFARGGGYVRLDCENVRQVVEAEVNSTKDVRQ